MLSYCERLFLLSALSYTHYNFGTPGTIFEWITHTFNALCCYQVITSCMQFKWKSRTAYILYREIWAKIGWYVLLHFVYFPNSYVHSILPNCQVCVTFLCWNNMLGYFNNFILKICGWIIYPTKGLMFLPFMLGILHGFKLTM